MLLGRGLSQEGDHLSHNAGRLDWASALLVQRRFTENVDAGFNLLLVRQDWSMRYEAMPGGLFTLVLVMTSPYGPQWEAHYLRTAPRVDAGREGDSDDDLGA